MRRPLFSKLERARLLAVLRAVSAAVLASLGIALVLAMISYEPSDPGVFSATWRKAQNWLGAEGATVADLLHRTIGVAGYAIGALLIVWAARIQWRAWPGQMLSRIVSTPLALLCLAAFASGEPEIARSGGGLGGLLGDTLFAMLNTGMPLESPRIRYIASVALLALVTPPFLMAAFGGSTWGLFGWIDRGRRDLAHIILWGYRAVRRGWRDIGGAGLGHGLAAAIAGLFAGWSAPRIIPAGGPAGFEMPNPFSGWRRPHAPEDSGLRRRRSMPKAPPSEEPGFHSVRRAAEQSTLREPGFSSDVHAPRAYAEPGFHAEEPDTVPAPGALADADFIGAEPEPADFAEPVGDAVSVPGWAAEAARAGARLAEIRRAAEEQRHREAEARDEREPPRRAEPEDAEEADDRVPIPAARSSAEARLERAVAPHREPVSAEPPSLDLLTGPEQAGRLNISERELAEKADRLQKVLEDYGVRGDIIHVSPGPVVSLFELEPAPGLKSARVVGLADDIARSMSAAACRVSPVPGKNLIGIELPNDERETVLLSELLASDAYQHGDWILPLALGKDIAGEPVIADLARMPHLLIAGTTGSGKSVAINTMLLSLFYRLTPQEARLILIDPKMLELSVYNGAPHLLAPVVTDPQKAVSALRWVVREMEARYQRMARLNVRSLESYNAKVAEAEGGELAREVQVGFCEETGQPIYETHTTPAEEMPRIVVVIDEMADLMLVAGKEIERLVQRLAQMARAAGIHLVMATQRPSVDVITGVIKANFPIRISFQVTSKIDSRTILNEPGAEQLLGKGDMLFTTGSGRLQRLHGPFVTDAEVEAVAARLQAMGPVDEPVDFDARSAAGAPGETDEDCSGDSDDALYDRAVAIVTAERKASTSFLQRRLQIGYNRAARLVDRLEAEGVVSPANHVGKRDVLVEAT